MYIFFNYKKKCIWKVTEVAEVSSLGCIGSGIKLQLRGPSELRREKSKVNITCLGEEDGERKGLGVLS